MRLFRKIVFLLIPLIIISSVGLHAKRRKEINKEFDKKEFIEINTLSGDCVIQKGGSDKIEVTVTHSYSETDPVEFDFTDRGKRLRLDEKIHGSVSGSCIWTISVPDNIEIEFSTTSGDMSIYDVSGEFSMQSASGSMDIRGCLGKFKMSTASGDCDITDTQGKFNINTASGDCNIRECKGEFDINSASGDIDAYDITLEDDSNFGVASGTVEVELAESARYDINIGSASGKAILDYGANPLIGYFEFTARYHSGRIVAPFNFDDEDIFRKHGEKYVRKSFIRETDYPTITIGTSTGKAVLKKR